MKDIAQACRTIDASETFPSLPALARAAGLSVSRFSRRFKDATGLSPKAYAQARKAERARAELSRGASVTEALYAAGYGSSGRFYEHAPGALGMRPSQFKRGGAGAVVRFAVGQCSLGAVLVAATPKGVCAVSLGDSPGPLVRELQDRFPKAELIGADPAFEKLVARVVGLIEKPGAGAGLPLDLQGTAFQLRVWNALRRVPSGKTTSYAALARAVGLPSGARAVARACASNLVAVAVPCHRVVRGDGSLSGYRWGVARKKALLEKEKA